jgi:hypothetical protein
MARYGLRIAVLFVLSTLWVADCKPSKKAKAPDEAESSASAEPPPPAPEPPKPKPKCESLDEKCVGESDSKLKIGSHGAWMRPPSGWTFAKEGDSAVAVPSSEDGVLGFVEGEGADPDKVVAALGPLLERLKIGNVKVPGLKPMLKKAQSEIEAANVKASLWEVDKKKNGGADPKLKDGVGTLLLVVAPAGSDRALVGAGFVLKTADPSRVKEIMDSIKTLRGGK